MKKIYTLILFCLIIISTVASYGAADEFYDTPGPDKILVDKDGNTITFLYDDISVSQLNEWDKVCHYYDVPETNQSMLYIYYLDQLGIMEGIDKNYYFPKNHVTYGEFAEIVNNIKKEKEEVV